MSALDFKKDFTYDTVTPKEYKLFQKRLDRDEDINEHTRVNARLAYFLKEDDLLQELEEIAQRAKIANHITWEDLTRRRDIGDLLYKSLESKGFTW